MTNKDKAKLKMAFLFLIADGKVTKDKYDAFDSIFNSIKSSYISSIPKISSIPSSIFSVPKISSIPSKDNNDSQDYFQDYRRKIINSCLGIFDGNISSYSEKKRFDTIKAEILSIAEDDFCYNNNPSKTQLEHLWMLISLAYNQGKLTQNKKNILKEICEQWEIKTVIAAEMMDTAETIISINDHKKWLNFVKGEEGPHSALNPFKKKSLINNVAVNSELEKNQEELIKSVNLLIEDEANPLDEEEEEKEDEEEWEDEDEDEDEYEDEDGEAPESEPKPDKDWIEGEEDKENNDDKNEEENGEDDDYSDDDSKDIWS
jgi:hypothetical protein